MFSSARPQLAKSQLHTQQLRHASLLRRPKRPYTFTQLITLSDGSTFLHRTTSPQPVYRSTKDTKNHAMWNPSSQKLLNVEEDEAGRLKRFRKRFGRGFDVEALMGEGEEGAAETRAAEDDDDANLLDLISDFTQDSAKKGKAAGTTEPKKRSGKGKGAEK
ncbi:uncharacterized protein LTR77_002920 [Saxophila tyrrhenica]|uniref:Ribosomal protein bL31m N-terminal domain-containing protein n=1 Tax=Saxophila tyrrhenica TaxID=1690608 RepID=A0AAV9PKD4_9PEZI|nr:hypothetical protein LTR77_002920 [Saxophila tyrrhenica]